jgi:hypothetical protein
VRASQSCLSGKYSLEGERDELKKQVDELKRKLEEKRRKPSLKSGSP